MIGGIVLTKNLMDIFYFYYRDVAFCPHGNGHIFAAGMENGQIQLWDVRRPDKYEKKWPAHSDHIFAVDWHPESRYTLASAGRDKQIKVWNTSEAKCEHLVYSIGPVGRIKWRPRHNYHLASCSGMVGDFTVSVWDVRRPYVPFAVFNEHKNVATDIKWLQDPERLLSGGKVCKNYILLFIMYYFLAKVHICLSISMYRKRHRRNIWHYYT